jgi:hypothetical protein
VEGSGLKKCRGKTGRVHDDIKRIRVQDQGEALRQGRTG